MGGVTSKQQKNLITIKPSVEFLSVSYKNIEADYKITDVVLGKGFSGKIVEIQCHNTKRLFALKSFQKNELNAQKIEMLRTEIQIHLYVDHPNIIRLMGAYETKNEIQMVLERAKGKDLFHRLLDVKIYKEHEAAALATQMLEAIYYLHAHGIVHRDIKLENWIFEDDGPGAYLKLLDFGFSTLWKQTEKPLTLFCGSLAYVAPEVIKGSYTNKSDIWSVGCVLFTLLGGYPLFYGTEKAMIENILSKEIKLVGKRWEKVSDEGKAFLLSLLDRNAETRLSAYQALQHPWLRSQQLNNTHRCSIRLSARRKKAIDYLDEFSTASFIEKSPEDCTTTAPLQSNLLVPTETLQSSYATVTAPLTQSFMEDNKSECPDITVTDHQQLDPEQAAEVRRESQEEPQADKNAEEESPNSAIEISAKRRLSCSIACPDMERHVMNKYSREIRVIRSDPTSDRGASVTRLCGDKENDCEGLCELSEILSCLRDFAQSPPLRRALFAATARLLTPSELPGTAELFRLFDLRKIGVLEEESFAFLMTQYFGIMQIEALQIFNALHHGNKRANLEATFARSASSSEVTLSTYSAASFESTSNSSDFSHRSADESVKAHSASSTSKNDNPNDGTFQSELEGILEGIYSYFHGKNECALHSHTKIGQDQHKILKKKVKRLSLSGEKKISYSDFAGALLAWSLNFDHADEFFGKRTDVFRIIDLLYRRLVDWSIMKCKKKEKNKEGVSMKALRTLLGNRISNRELLSAFKLADKDGDGVLNFEEFYFVLCDKTGPPPSPSVSLSEIQTLRRMQSRNTLNSSQDGVYLWDEEIPTQLNAASKQVSHDFSPVAEPSRAKVEFDILTAPVGDWSGAKASREVSCEIGRVKTLPSPLQFLNSPASPSDGFALGSPTVVLPSPIELNTLRPSSTTNLITQTRESSQMLAEKGTARLERGQSEQTQKSKQSNMAAKFSNFMTSLFNGEEGAKSPLKRSTTRIPKKKTFSIHTNDSLSMKERKVRTEAGEFALNPFVNARAFSRATRHYHTASDRDRENFIGSDSLNSVSNTSPDRNDISHYDNNSQLESLISDVDSLKSLSEMFSLNISRMHSMRSECSASSRDSRREAAEND